MQVRHSPIVLSRRSSLLSPAPHTPRSCPSPALPVYLPSNPNRNSTDSWNSSNADDIDCDWKQDHVLLLSRTLDALPAHLVTPFHDPIPPSNLLDKIARGVAHAKGPADWPHSIRATRVKLLELARTRAKEEALAEQRRQAIQEEDLIHIDDGSLSHYSYYHDAEDNPICALAAGPRRPLYRQSSMDFIKPSPADIKDNPNIAKLSNRLQRTDRSFPNPSYHPYSRIPRSQQLHQSIPNRRSSSPPHPADVPALITPSNSLSSLSSEPRVLRRTASTLSSTSMFSNSSQGMPLPDPRIQRVRRSDSFAPAPPPKDIPAPTPRSKTGIKRAPSYGTLAQEARIDARVHERKLSGSYPSSDEEEKARTKRAKKVKTKPDLLASPPPSSAPPSPATPMSPAQRTPVKVKSKAAGSEDVKMKSPSTSKPVTKAVKDAPVRPRPAPMNLQRNPSMFGAELPPLPMENNAGLSSAPSAFLRAMRSPPLRAPPTLRAPPAPLPVLSPPLSGAFDTQPPLSPPSSPSPATTTQKVRTLRRVRRLAPARRISFGSLVAPGDEADADGEGELLMSSSSKGVGNESLGSAFQLH